MANEKFYLIFSEQPGKKIYINEPIGYGDVDFNLNQKENGHGRDIALNGGENQFRFTDQRHEKILTMIFYYNDFYGFEADVKLSIVLEDGTEYLNEIDFSTAETDDLTYFDFKTITVGSLQIFKRRSETKVDLLSNTDIDGNVITPLRPINMFLKAKPSIQKSTWEQVLDYDRNLDAVGGTNTTWYQVNPVANLVKSDVKDSYTFFEDTNKLDFQDRNFTDSNFKILLASSNLSNVKINIKDLNIKFETDVDDGGNGYVNFNLKIFKGLTWQNSTEYNLLKTYKTEHQSYIFSGDLPEINIGSVLRSESVWMFFEFEVRQSASDAPFSTPKFEVFTKIEKGTKINVEAESISYNSITPVFRLIDVMRQVAKSISGLDIYAPRYDFGGEFYDNVLLNGNLLRNITNKPFYVSWDDIWKSINGELYADDETQVDGRIFIGIEEDFYTKTESWFFDNVQFSELNKSPNPKYCLNEFKFKYKNYQSLKENEVANSADTIHGESIWTPLNKKVENSKEANVEWTRDAMLISQQQEKALTVSEDTSTQDDDNIFCIDTIETVNDQKFTENTELQHSFDGTFLILKNNGSLNFIVLGIQPNTTFEILHPDKNKGIYNVSSVTNTELQLQKTSAGTISSSNDGIRTTTYIYEIKKTYAELTSRSDEGFLYVLNLLNPEKYSNLKYSVKRNIQNYWNSFLATVNIYNKLKPIKNTFYKNNGECSMSYNGLATVEKEDFIPDNPIVTPFMYNEMIFANFEFSDFVALQYRIRTQRGFIRTIDNNIRVLKVYPINMSYNNANRELTISGQEKYETAFMTIRKEANDIVINEETRIKALKYTEESNKIVLFDNQMQRLYNGVFWDKISVNGVNATSITELKNWLDLL